MPPESDDGIVGDHASVGVPDQLTALTAQALAATAKFRSVFNQSSIFAGIMDLDGTLREANELSLKACGYRAEQAIGLPFWETPWWRGSAEVQATIRDAVARASAGEVFKATLPYWLADGSECVVDFAMHPIKDERGRVLFLSPTGIDITDRVRAEALLRRNHETFFNLVQNSPFGIYVVDADFRLRQVGKGALRVFENVRPLLGRDFADVLRQIWVEPFASEAIARFRHTLATGEPYVAVDTTEQRQDLDAVESYDWRIERITLPDGEYGVVCYFYDLTAIRQVQEALRTRNEQYLAAQKALQEADRRKDEFLATLAHELRNPLAAIRMALGVLGRGQDDPTHVARMCTIIDRQSAQLVRLIDDLLDVSRITRGKLELQKAPVDLARTIEHAVEGVAAMCEGKGLRLTVRSPARPLVVQADALRFAQVVSNLLNNACKFTDAGGAIEIWADRDGSDAVVGVRDTGVGIPPGELARVFEMFAQVDGPQTKGAGGLGIGLSLAKSIVALHGGTIEARSDGPQRGSEFIVRVPLTAEMGGIEAAAPATEPASETLRHARLRVLAVDDNRDALEAVTVMLQMAGFTVLTGSTGEEAVELARAHRPAALLLDIGLPGLDGYEIARQIRRESWGASIRLVAMTGWGQEKDKARAREAGFDAHLTKPVDAEELVRVLAGV